MAEAVVPILFCFRIQALHSISEVFSVYIHRKCCYLSLLFPKPFTVRCLKPVTDDKRSITYPIKTNCCKAFQKVIDHLSE